MNAAFEYTTALEYRIKALKNELDKFKSGEKYLTMQEDSRKSIRSLERKVKERDQEISRSHQETVRVRKYWFEVFEDMQKEHAREVAFPSAAYRLYPGKRKRKDPSGICLCDTGWESPVLCTREERARRGKGHRYRRLPGDPCP